MVWDCACSLGGFSSPSERAYWRRRSSCLLVRCPVLRPRGLLRGVPLLALRARGPAARLVSSRLWRSVRTLGCRISKRARGQAVRGSKWAMALIGPGFDPRKGDAEKEKNPHTAGFYLFWRPLGD